MKPKSLIFVVLFIPPAAFRRLCVETTKKKTEFKRLGPAAFRRLCVETRHNGKSSVPYCPAAFRRLCVETS